MKIGFDNDKHLRMQSGHIRGRISKLGDKLYLEFGGKLFDNYHASRVLPGLQPDSRLRMLLQLADQAKIIITISAVDVEKNKIRGDLGITYDADMLRLTQVFCDTGLYIGSVVITRYTNAADQSRNKLEVMGTKVYRRYPIDGYPANVLFIMSEDGYGKDEYIETTRSLITVTVPGSGSGKMVTCLPQLYHENHRGVKAGYAKFETSPTWNPPLNHPVNLAYEAATADLNDVNMIDLFHLEAYGKTTVNCNRDVEIFPVLSVMFEGIYGSCPYKSPIDMGINMTGNCIVDDGVCREAGRQETIRRQYVTMDHLVEGESRKSEVTKVEFLIKQAGVTTANRPVVHTVFLKVEVTGASVAATELPDGRIVTGKISELLGVSAAALLDAVKTLGDIPDEIKLIFPTAIEPVQALKINYLGSKNPRLHTDEILIALSMNAVSNPNAVRVLEQLKKFHGCQMHTSVVLPETDIRILNKLGL